MLGKPFLIVLRDSSGLEVDAVSKLAVTDGIDVWRIGSGGKIDFRVTWTKWQEIKRGFPGCDASGYIDTILKNAHKVSAKEMPRNRTEVEWFDEYVS